MQAVAGFAGMAGLGAKMNQTTSIGALAGGFNLSKLKLLAAADAAAAAAPSPASAPEAPADAQPLASSDPDPDNVLQSV